MLSQPRAELAAGVVQGLVESAAGGVLALREHVDGDVVERDRDEHRALMGSEDLGDRVADGADQLAGFRLGLGSRVAVIEQLRPPVVVQRDLAPVPWPAAHLRGGLEERELVGPRRKPAVAAKAVQLVEDREERVGSGLHREIVELAPALPVPVPVPAVR